MYCYVDMYDVLYMYRDLATSLHFSKLNYSNAATGLSSELCAAHPPRPRSGPW